MRPIEAPLPAGWAVARIGDIADLNPPLDGSAGRDNPIVSFVPMAAVEAETGVVELSRTRRLNDVRKGYRPFRERDVLFAKITPCMENGKMTVVPRLEHGLGFGSTEFHVLRPHREISSDYLYRLVAAAQFRRDAERHMTGAVGQRRVPTSYLADQTVPLPPTAEQRRIVAKIEDLSSELDNGVAMLKKAREQLGPYRQAVLTRAFEGKLTTQWRERNSDKLENRDQLLGRIRHELGTHYQRKVRQWETACKARDQRDNQRARPRKPKKPPTLVQNIYGTKSILPGLPESWTWGKLSWMTCGVEYGTATKSAPSGDVPVLRMGNIQDGKIDWDDLVYTSRPEEIYRYLLKDGDVLFNRTNSPELVGKTAIYADSRPAIFAGYIIRINHIESIVDSQYLNLFLNSHVARQHGNSVKTDGVNQSNISGAKLIEYPFPYCSLEEQHEAVTVLDRILVHVDEVEAEINRELLSVDTLRQAILKKAFSGQLVPQDPSDEPASALLDRIRADRAQVTKRSTPRKTGRRRTTKTTV